jgi:hypothetical protein
MPSPDYSRICLGVSIFSKASSQQAYSRSRSTSPMLWRASTRRSLLRNSFDIAARPSITQRLVRGRKLSSLGPDDESLPWDTTWTQQIDGLESGITRQPGDTAAGIPLRKSAARGVSINKQGQLQVVSRKDARKSCRTALIVTAASINLTAADFIRLVPERLGPKDTFLEGLSTVDRRAKAEADL